jgi:geranylgeranyl diphosphate synthase type I
MNSFAPSLNELRNLCDSELKGFLAARAHEVPEAAELIAELERLTAAGGKRLRPSFCYWGYRAAGGPPSSEIVRAATSLELLHTFAIVHDDIMDDSDERRGEATVHVRRGSGFAILAGDLALVLADELFFSSGFEPSALHRAFASYSVMRQEVIAGQHLDVAAAGRLSISEDEARRIAILKSGRYSIEKPLVIGARLAGANDDLARDLSRFGDPLGEAFQLRDDLLGTFGERSQTGKPTDSDIREGKRHVLFAKTMALLEGDDREFFAHRWGGREDLVPAEVDMLRGLIESSGARAATEDLLGELARAALDRLAKLPIGAESKDALGALAREATERQL